MPSIINIRDEFPIFQQKVNDHPLCYLDSGASAQKPKILLDTIQEIYTQYYANVHRGAYYFSEKTTFQYEEARKSIASFINAEEKEIIFTHNTTSAINLVQHSYARHFLKENDKIVTTIMEHHANMVPWQILRDDKKIILEYVHLHKDGTLDLEDLQKKLKNCKLLAITHISNVLGTINPIKEIIAMAHREGALVLVDGSQAVMHEKIDVKELDADFYIFTGHKLYGPNSIGVLYGKYDLLTKMPPFISGGDMIEHVSLEKTTFALPPSRFEAGTPPIMEAIGLGVVIEWFKQYDLDEIKQHENKLLAKLIDGLQKIDNITILGHAANRAPIVSFVIDTCHPHDLSTLLNQYGVCVRAGLHCAEPLAKFYHINASIRASIGVYNNDEDIDRFFEALDKSMSILQKYGT